MSISLDQVKKAVDDFFGDTSRTKAETKDGLEEIAEYADMRADTIDVDDGIDEDADEDEDGPAPLPEEEDFQWK